MTGRHIPNRLLAALPPAAHHLLAPYLRVVTLAQGMVLLHAGERIDPVYFPHSGVVSFVVDMPKGETVATALVGREGAVGVFSVLGPVRSSVAAIVRVAGSASQISASRFQAAFAQSEAIRRIVEFHTGSLLTQLQHVAACNALHSVEARIARWLLEIHDRMDGNAIPLTQEAVSQLVGVRRTTVTLVMLNLRKIGAINHEQRGLIEINRPILEGVACDCYEVMRQKADRVTPQQAIGTRIQAVLERETPL